ncbi:DUF1102 domain-containing protein [Thermococcus sp. M39]|uniref:DUF1102 domain-containing protein n=1 Tax=unclassified Thermococcus TaxID=2627626 RepID=UPI00143B209A|nr:MULTISPECIES: DUF1102 domain-containing protein [unclassified Thermococcus]NJE09194.1 DUF1102 domain-containing protein [Thermococcus sp. M39]NJE13770.1 DUF1102 domain-containing protein [Thermococcus sp. LS2]
MKKVKKLALGIFGLLVAFGLVLGAGANFSDYNASRSVHWHIVPDDDELIDLTPLQPYAYIDNVTGVLVIDFSVNNPNYPGYGNGISPASEYNFDEVFEVSNDLWENVTIVVRITSNSTNVEFYGHEGDVYEVANGTIASSSDTADEDVCFVVAPGDAVKIGLDLSADGDSPGDIWNVAMSIKAYRLGTEPTALVGKCGQP